MRKLILLGIMFSSFLVFAQKKENSKSRDNSSISIETTESDSIYVICEKLPQFPGGSSSLMQFLAENLQWPNPEIDVLGTVIVKFVVEIDGSLSNIEAINKLEPEFDAEAVRVTRLMPKWIPGEQAGKKVRVKFTLPIKFRLQ